MRLVAAIAAAIVLMTSPALHAQDTAAESASAGPGDWWSARYFVDYGLIAAGAASFLIAHELGPNPNAILGPRYDADDPEAILDPRYAGTIGEPFSDESTVVETFPEKHLFIMIVAMAGALAAEEGAYWAFAEDGSPQRFHDTMVGFAESLALTAGVTEIAKATVGRLRPDYQDRARRYICQTDSSTTLDCTTVPPLGDTREKAEYEMQDGRKSFFSGHSSFSLNFTTYIALTLGGNYVWSTNATPTSRALGILGQTVLVTTGLMIAGSRLDDGFHHVTDVLVGSAVGFGLANFAYWRRFGGREDQNASGTNSLQLQVDPLGPPSVSMSFRF